MTTTCRNHTTSRGLCSKQTSLAAYSDKHSSLSSTPEHADPDEETAGAEEDGAEVPEVAARLPKLDQLLQDGPDDDEDVVDANHDVPNNAQSIS